MYNLINVCTQLIIWLFQGYCLQYFFGSFLASRERTKKWNSLCVVALYVVFKYFIKLVLPSEYGDMRAVGKQVMTFAVLIILALSFYKAVKAITGFLVITFMAVCEIGILCTVTVGNITEPLLKFWNWCMYQGYISSADTFEIVVGITVISTQILSCVVAVIIPVASILKIVQSFRDKEYAVDRTGLLFLLAPGMVGLLLCVLLEIFMQFFESGTANQIYQESPLLFLIIPAILLLSLLPILYSIQLFQDMIDRNREKNSRIILEKQVSSMQEQIVEMEHIHSGIRSMKHDMKNTLTIIMQLAERKGNTENTELHAYLSELNQTFDRLDFHFKTGNTVVDTLLNMKYHEIMCTIPDLQMNADKLLFPESLMIQSYDIGVILGNALDNAIEACKKLKAEEKETEIFINLSSFSKGKMFFIEVENSFNGEVIRKREAEFPVTTKADKKIHGIGLTNIKNTAEKYHGGVDWTINQKVFTLSVMLKNEQGM